LASDRVSSSCFSWVPGFLIEIVSDTLSPISVKDALRSSAPIARILVQGWVRTRRDAKDFSFIELNDGSCLRNLQIIAKNLLANYAEVQRLTTGASIIVEGELVASQGKGQSWEVVAEKIDIVGLADDSYPLQKKGHTPEFLREIAHLRPRSNLFGCVFRVRSRLAFAIHNFFKNAASFTSTRRSSREAIAKAQANCFASPLSTPRILRERKMARSITRKTFSRARLT